MVRNSAIRALCCRANSIAVRKHRSASAGLQLIVGQSVTPAANDKEQIQPMVQVIKQQSGQRPAGILADNGYCSEKNLEYLATTGQAGHPIDAYIATGKQKHDEYRQPCPCGPLPRNATRVDRMKRKLQTRAGVSPLPFARLG